MRLAIRVLVIFLAPTRSIASNLRRHWSPTDGSPAEGRALTVPAGFEGSTRRQRAAQFKADAAARREAAMGHNSHHPSLCHERDGQVFLLSV